MYNIILKARIILYKKLMLGKTKDPTIWTLKKFNKMYDLAHALMTDKSLKRQKLGATIMLINEAYINEHYAFFKKHGYTGNNVT